MPKIHSVTIIGFFLSIAGAILDFTSGSPMIQSQTMYNTMGFVMSTYNPQYLVVPLNVLGILVLATGIISITPIGKGRMGLFGGVMVALGVIMVLIGVDMYSSAGMAFPTMELLGTGMLLVGVLMAINGIAMAFAFSNMKM
ncbi:MAG: hypothetical protein ACYC7D_09800 [Nitrososphaerales archaeon]